MHWNAKFSWRHVRTPLFGMEWPSCENFRWQRWDFSSSFMIFSVAIVKFVESHSITPSSKIKRWVKNRNSVSGWVSVIGKPMLHYTYVNPIHGFHISQPWTSSQWTPLYTCWSSPKTARNFLIYLPTESSGFL